MILTERVHFVPIRAKEPYSYPYGVDEVNGNILNLLRKFFSVIGTGLAGISKGFRERRNFQFWCFGENSNLG